MRKSLVVAGLLIGIWAAAAGAATLDDVKARGRVLCGVNADLIGFAALDANGVWQGFDVAMCRALAAAIFGDPMAVEFVRTDTRPPSDPLLSGQVDILARYPTWTLSNDVGRKYEFPVISFFDGQGLMVARSLGVSSVKELNGFRVCAQAGTMDVQNLNEYFQINAIANQIIPAETVADALRLYQGGGCDALSTNIASLAASRATFATPGDHVILPEAISKEPFGPAVRQGDSDWTDLVRWVVNALIAAEELGITSANLEELANGAATPEVNRLLGKEGNLGGAFGIDHRWAYLAIKAGGNYGEIFERNIGETTPIGLARGLNAQWKDGGLLYALPFR